MSKKLVAAFRDLTDRKDVVFHGPGSFVIGLSSDGSIVVEPESNTDAVCVVLLELSVGTSGGYVLAPANYDLLCMVNESEELAREINLIDGTRLEVASKTLVFIDGPIPVRRRKLPRTPGMPLEDGPPVKPSRAQTTENQGSSETAEQDLLGISVSNGNHDENDNSSSTDDDDDDDDGGDRRWLETSWCMLDMPTAEQQLFTDLKTPEQISIVAASYFCKQLRLFTDAVLTMQLLDDIFKLFKDSIAISKDIFLDYLSEISRVIQKNPHRSQTRPMHGPAIKLLNSLLKQSLEPLSRVILLLDLMRTFSHFDSNMATMALHQVAATIVGCMSVYCDVVEVQAYGLDTLAKIAKFRPVIDKKAPLREGAIQIMLKSEEQHHKDLTICRALCRVLANLAESLTDVANSLLDKESAGNQAVAETIERYEECLLFMFKRSLPVIQTILDDHGTDLGVRTEGRKFVYYYAKLPQLQQKKKAWQQTLQQEEETVIEIRDESNTSASAIHDLLAYPEDEKEPRGILKKAGSFENLRDPEKRITFVDCTVGGSASDTSSSEDDMFEGPFPEPKIPTELEPDHQFQQHIIKAFIGKTIGKTKHRSKDSDDSSDSSDDDSFLIQKSKKHKKQRPVKTVAALDSNGHGTEKNGMKIGTPKPDSQVIVQRMEMGVNKELEQDTKELNFVENHYRNSFCSGTEQRDDTKVSNVVSSADNVNDRNTPENNTRINTDTRNNYENTIVTEENRNSEITVSHENVYSAPNGFHQSVLSGSPQHACINDDSSENGRRLVDDNKVPKIGRAHV